MELSVYLDTSVLVALLLTDDHSARAERLLSKNTSIMLVSDLAAAEFASVMANRVRSGRLLAENARIAFATFDAWVARSGNRVAVTSADIAAADSYLRRLDLTLRTPDAIHIAISDRIGAALATFDVKMARCARLLGLPVHEN